MGKELAKIYQQMLEEYKKALEEKLKKGDLRGANVIQKKITQLKRAIYRHSKKK